MQIIPHSLLQKALCGAPFTRAEAALAATLLPGILPDLMAAARLSASAGGQAAFACGIINAKSGHCAENCAFCAQSAHHNTGAAVHSLVSLEALLERAEVLHSQGAAYMGMVISGASPSTRECEALCEAANRIRCRVDIRLCASLGMLDQNTTRMLQQAGFSSYHHNLETSAGFYPSICTTHAYERRVETVRLAGEAGLRVCSGGIFGLGETWEQRFDLLAELRELKVHSLPINFLTPIPGTPLGLRPLLPRNEAVAIIALARLMHPARDIIICGGRATTLGAWEPLLFAAGANAVMIGNYLTTPGSSPANDRRLMHDLGLRP